MNKNLMIVAAMATLALVSCKDKTKAPVQVAVEQETVATSPEVTVTGTYEGVLPCADCEGVKYVLTLKEDGTYAMESTYLGKKDAKPFVDQGKYSLADSVLTIEVLGDTALYKVGEQWLEKLDKEGKPIESAQNYKLTKKAE
jgi:uncharacterized lipoprotein NlpE involved in copper resistance